VVSWEIREGDCREVMASMAASSVDAIVTDPPYGLSFMGKGWDHGVPGVEFWTEALRVAKPGAHLLAFGGTRTYHRLACAIEDAGWEIRDCVMWVYGSGFPKSLDVSKAIDKAAGAEREVVGPGRWNSVKGSNEVQADCLIRPGGKHMETTPATPAAKQWSGWGTALKPAWEPIIVARKPFKGTVAANVLEHGTGAVNVDGCRVGDEGGTKKTHTDERNIPSNSLEGGADGSLNGGRVLKLNAGRWPANLILDAEAGAMVDEQAGERPSGSRAAGVRGASDNWSGRFSGDGGPAIEASSGGPSRFFYCAKASKADRSEGNNHPTVKPHDLMRYLCRLVTPPGGIVLDPFMGSGSTGKAAVREGFGFIGIEREAEYARIARCRIQAALG
jgi:hypothetical protein